MSTLVVPQVSSGLSTEELSDLVAKLAKDVDWFSRNIDSKNVRNIAGYNVTEFELKHMSGIVGMSGYDYANPNAIRFWSGSANKEEAPFRVTQGGVMTAVGGLFMSSTGYPRVELNSDSDLFAAYQTASKYVSMNTSSGGTPGIAWNDGELVAYMIASQTVGILLAAFTGNVTLQSANNISLNPSGSLRINGFDGYTGDFTVITDVDFTNGTTDSKRVEVKKGIITSVS